MKILLTGKPGSGKTTLLANFIKAVPDKQGFIAREVRKDHERSGFELISSAGQSVMLASVDSDSDVRVSRYGIEVEQFDNFLANLPSLESNNLLYIDEIGQMELFSDKFKDVVIFYLNSGHFYVGTITSIFKDDFTEQILGREDIILLNINKENRDQAQEALRGLAENIEQIRQLQPMTQKYFSDMAKNYAKRSSFVQLKKLFKNAARYLVEGRVQKINNDTYSIKGDTNEHVIIRKENNWACDCDLFDGRGIFEGFAGECSHIQAVKLSLV